VQPSGPAKRQINGLAANRLQMERPTPGWQYGADGGAGAVGGHQDRNLFIANPRFDACRRACGLAIEVRSPLTTAQEQTSRRHSTIPRSLIAARRQQPAGSVTPAKSRACRPTPQRAAEVFTVRNRLTTQQIPSSNPCGRSRLRRPTSGR